MDEVLPDWIVRLSPLGVAVTLVATAVWFVYTGRLIPKKVHDEVKEDRDYWRSFAKELILQNQELMAGARVATRVTDALPLPSREDVAREITP